MATYRSPGVYVEEISLLPPSIAEVESAVPAFIGYTEKAVDPKGNSLTNVPTRIESLRDYESLFGVALTEDHNNITIAVNEITSGSTVIDDNVKITLSSLSKHILYHAVRHFFANGGGSCYIVSVGPYTSTNAIGVNDLSNGLNKVENEDAPTMLLVPEAIYLTQTEFANIIQQMLKQAGDLKDRFAIIDTFETTVPKTSETITADTKTKTTDSITENKRYGAVYYPFLETSYNFKFDFDALTLTHHTVNGNQPITGDKTGSLMSTLKGSAMYNAIEKEFKKYHITLPPSAAIAGIYAKVDRDRGYWKAPANVGLLNVVKPVISLSRTEHDLLNINPDTGKSVNAIVSLPGGIYVMGARTLDGNDNEWKYINVRRFFSVVEESVKKSISWVVFEPNTASTWVKVQAMIENYLFQKWRDGALAGAKPEQAYFVNVGLGKTMTPIDILEGRMFVEIGMAVARPAEFIILKFEQIMQAS
jgi:phage tail sheath protein FI